jgi:hypothetical protein
MGKRKEFEILGAQLDQEFSTFKTHYQDLADFILPRRAQFTLTDTNRGDRRNLKIIDSTGSSAAGTLRAGLMANVTSPARPWFKLTSPNPVLQENDSVKQWLDDTTRELNRIFLKSNIYNVLPIVYGDLGVFQTGCMFIDEDAEECLRCYAFPIGSYRIANDEKGRVRVFMRDFRMTVRQLIAKFGYDSGEEKTKENIHWERFSTMVKSAHDQGSMETWVDVRHFVTPNDEHDPRKLESKYKAFYSCYYERGCGNLTATAYTDDNAEKFLEEKGYDYFPVLAPRWEVTGADSYGTDGPGMRALGDIKSLQLMHKRMSQGVEKQINPPMVASNAMKNQRSSIVAGDITYVPDLGASGNGFRPAIEVKPDLAGMSVVIQDTRAQIKKAFYEDLFLMLSNLTRREMTATEVDVRQEEKLLALGPVLEQLNQDLLDPTIDIGFFLALKQGRLPEPPPELAGADLKVEYISVMAQAQKLVALNAVERFFGGAERIVAANPESKDKLDYDQMIDEYADILSVRSRIVRSDADVEKIRKQRAKRMQEQAQMENVERMSVAAKNLAAAPMDGDNALTQITSGDAVA